MAHLYLGKEKPLKSRVRSSTHWSGFSILRGLCTTSSYLRVRRLRQTVTVISCSGKWRIWGNVHCGPGMTWFSMIVMRIATLLSSSSIILQKKYGSLFSLLALFSYSRLLSLSKDENQVEEMQIWHDREDLCWIADGAEHVNKIRITACIPVVAEALGSVLAILRGLLRMWRRWISYRYSTTLFIAAFWGVLVRWFRCS